MNHLQFLCLIVAVWLAGPTTVPAAAQTSCPYVTFRLDTTMEVDRTVVCQAAEIWSEHGYEIFVYLTDFVPVDEDQWFAHLDEIEVQAGIRDEGAADQFELNVLAIEASARSGADWTNTLTYGQWLFDTDLDNDRRLDGIAVEMDQALDRNDATAAFAGALQSAGQAVWPPPSLFSRSIPWLLGAIITGVAGVILYWYVIAPWLRERRRRQALQGHLDGVQQNVANLLLACERLLSGEEARDTVLFQLFLAYGGDNYPSRSTAALSAIQKSQEALGRAFSLRRALLDDAVQLSQSLESRIRGWETIYLTLSGSNPEVLQLTESELKDLLNPLIVLQQEPPQDNRLAKQLDEIQREIEGMPLKIELRQVDPASVDEKGILGRLFSVEAQIQELIHAHNEAPVLLEEIAMGIEQATVEVEKFRPFDLSTEEVMAGLKSRQTSAEEDLAHSRFLDAKGAAEDLLRDLDIVADLGNAAADDKKRWVEIATVVEQGYRPPELAGLREEAATDRREIAQQVRLGQFLRADDWLDELDADGERALEHAHSWRERHLFNVESIRLMRKRLEDAETILIREASPAWIVLSTYPAANWHDITESIDELERALHDMIQGQMPDIERANGLEIQDIPLAESLLETSGQSLLQIENKLRAISNRLLAVQAAEENLPAGFEVAEGEIERVSAYRDHHDRKIGSVVDSLITGAEQQLLLARDHAGVREFYPATTAINSARSQAEKAYSQAIEEVREIDKLVAGYDEGKSQAAEWINLARAAASTLPPAAQTEAGGELWSEMNSKDSEVRQHAADIVALEDRAWATGLTNGIALLKSLSELAGQAAEKLKSDKEAYETLLAETQKAIKEASKAIELAERAVNHGDAKGEGRNALIRAQRTLPASTGWGSASQSTLRETIKDAQLAGRYAQEARRKADEAIRRRQAARQAASMPTISSFGGGRSFWGSGSGRSGNSMSRPRSSNRSMSSSSRRSSFSGSSRRSSSRGSSRRSSSRGGSRRR